MAYNRANRTYTPHANTEKKKTVLKIKVMGVGLLSTVPNVPQSFISLPSTRKVQKKGSWSGFAIPGKTYQSILNDTTEFDCVNLRPFSPRER
jgi:hypothetical protein